MPTTPATDLDDPTPDVPLDDDPPTNGAGFRISEPPPLPPSTSDEERHRHAMAVWATKQTCLAIDAHDKNDSRRAARIAKAVAGIGKEIDEQGETQARVVADLAEQRSWGRRMVERGAELATSALREAWATFKAPLATLATGAAAYYAWAHYQIPATPTPVPVTVVGDAAPTPPQDAPTSPAAPTPAFPSAAAATPDGAAVSPAFGPVPEE